MHVGVAIQISVQRHDAPDVSLLRRGANGDLERFEGEGAILGAGVVQESAHCFAGPLDQAGVRGRVRAVQVVGSPAGDAPGVLYSNGGTRPGFTPGRLTRAVGALPNRRSWRVPCPAVTVARSSSSPTLSLLTSTLGRGVHAACCATASPGRGSTCDATGDGNARSSSSATPMMRRMLGRQVARSPRKRASSRGCASGRYRAPMKRARGV
jgi:hypothetical protein